MAKLEAGATAPAFALPDQDGKPVKLSDFKGQRVIVYFYPADDTPGCTKEACQFNDNLRAFARTGVAVLGVSPDGAENHTRFRQKYGLRFPLLTDTGHEAADRLFAARRQGLREMLADWSPDEYAELGELLTKLSRALLGDDADRNLINAEPTISSSTSEKAPGS